MRKYKGVRIMKIKKFFAFKNKFLISLITFSLATTAVLIPISNNHSIDMQNNKTYGHNNSNDKVLNNIEELENSIKINNSNKNIDSQISYFDQNFDKNIQKKFFENINTDEIMKQANSLIKSNAKISEKSKFNSYNLKNKEINKNINQENNLKDIIKKIKSGELSPSSILKIEKKYSSENSESYKKIITDILNDSKKFKTINKKITNLNYNVKSYVNKSFVDIDNSSQDNDSYLISIDKNQYNFFMDLEKQKNRLFQYENKIYGFAIASATLTAAAWVLSVFYWSAWWMFGANIPFAIASTTQASIMTYFTTESWNNYYDTKNARIQIENYLNSSDYKETKEAILYLLNEKSVKKDMSNFTIKFIISTLVPNTFFPKLISRFLKKGLSKAITSIMSKLYANLGKSIFKNILKKIESYLSKLSLKKSILAATSWASPASTVISILDTILSIFDFFGDITLYGMYS